ncbi:MAG: hypothetical protein D6729_05590 [Deltaproteobacteria bacterium]|nr:MAG: hypothetical protein D6729_05590 [Deltaproteobacteria bacterium]
MAPVLLLLLGGCAAADPALRRPGPLSFTSQAAPTLQMAGGGATGQLTVRYRFHPSFFVDGVGRSGIVVPKGFAPDDTFFLALAAGVGWRVDLGQWIPRVALRFTHIHHATFESWHRTPWASLAGDSSGTVQHRSGAELAVGLRSATLNRLGNWGLFVDLEASAGVLP